MIKTLQDCLLIFDDSCEEIYQEKDFVKIAVSGRHRGIHCIFVRHNLFHQSRWSRTIHLKITHIILFNSRRDSQQIQFLGKQLNKVNFLKECHTKAVAEPHGQRLINLDPKRSECLRFWSDIVDAGPTIIYLPSSQAKITEITNEREKFAYTQSLGKTHFNSATKTVEKLLQRFSDILLWVCTQCYKRHRWNQLKRVTTLWKQLRLLCKKSTSVKERRKILMSSKGLKLMNLINQPYFYLTDWIL